MRLTLKAQAILYQEKALREALDSLDKDLITEEQYTALKLTIRKEAKDMMEGKG